MPTVAPGQALDLKAKLFRGLSDSSRLAILEALRDGPHSVSEVIQVTGLSQSNASNHLACLHECGLARRDPHGRFVYYGLSDERVEELLGTADALLLEVAKGIYDCVRYRGPAETRGRPEHGPARWPRGRAARLPALPRR